MASSTTRGKKYTKKATVVVNGKKRSSTGSHLSHLKQLFANKLPMILVALIFGCVGLYFLVRSFAATPTASTSAFNVTTWNSNYANKYNVGKEIKKLGQNSDIIAIQEAHKYSQRNNIKSSLLCSKCTYAGYMPESKYFKSHNGSSAASLPILWNKSKFRLIEKGNIKTSSAKKGFKDSTGKNVKVSAKYLTWVRLRDNATGRSFYVINIHTVASVEAGGNPNSNSTRLAIYDKNMNALVKKINAFKSAADRPVIVLGDFNVNYRYDVIKQNSRFPYKKLSDIGVHSTYERLNLLAVGGDVRTQGGKGSRLIDYIYTLDHDRLAVNNEYIDSATYGSDHHPVSATLTIYAKAIAQNTSSIPIGTSNPSTTDGVADEQSAVDADSYGE